MEINVRRCRRTSKDNWFLIILLYFFLLAVTFQMTIFSCVSIPSKTLSILPSLPQPNHTFIQYIYSRCEFNRMTRVLNYSFIFNLIYDTPWNMNNEHGSKHINTFTRHCYSLPFILLNGWDTDGIRLGDWDELMGELEGS